MKKFSVFWILVFEKMYINWEARDYVLEKYILWRL